MKVKILGHEYDIVFDEFHHNRDNNTGCFVSRDQRIEIAKDAKKSVQQETILHEIFEAFIWQMQIKMEHDDLSRCSELLYHIMKDNPEVRKAIWPDE